MSVNAALVKDFSTDPKAAFTLIYILIVYILIHILIYTLNI